MSVIEKFSTISTTLSKLFDFLLNSEVVKEDVQEYLKTVSAYNQSSRNIQSVLIPYLFERNLNQKSMFDIYLETSGVKDKEEIAIVKSLAGTFESVFEIQKLMKNGFVFQNLLNEKVYNVLPLVKMTNFRSVLAGQFAIARIFEHEGTFYLIEISNIFASYQKDEVYRFAIAKLLEKPELLYTDNPKKQEELENIIADFSGKFKAFFGTTEILSDNKNVDELISLFNDYCESNDESLKDEVAQYIKQPSEFKFFHIKEFESAQGDFIKSSMGGFSAHQSTYDVGMIFEDKSGLYVIPFWATLKHGFESDWKQIENFADCLKSVIENDKIPNTIFERLNDAYPNFMTVINEVLGEPYTFEQLMQKYKMDYLTKKIFSPTTVLYSSEIFSKTLNIMEQEEEQAQKPKKARPNDPCPCGSGKKYKKCCGA